MAIYIRPWIPDPICPVRDGFYPIHSVNGVGAGDVLKTRAGLGRGRGMPPPPHTRPEYNTLIKTLLFFLNFNPT